VAVNRFVVRALARVFPKKWAKARTTNLQALVASKTHAAFQTASKGKASVYRSSSEKRENGGRMTSMPNIRITAIPPGEAPESVRESWVGLSLPIVKGDSVTPRKLNGCGVLSGPKGFWSSLSHWIFKRFEVWEGYRVNAPIAVEILSREHPEAANWWYREAPHIVQLGKILIFPANVCEVEDR